MDVNISRRWWLITIAVLVASGGQAHAWQETTHLGKRYGMVQLSSSPWNWQRAERNANFRGGHLVTVDGPELNQWLLDTFLTGSPDRAYIGLHYKSGFGPPEPANWRWSGTEDVSPIYRNFAPGFPGGDFVGNDDAVMRQSDGKWENQADSSIALYGIYEKPASIVPLSISGTSNTFNASVDLPYAWDWDSGATSAHAYVNYQWVGDDDSGFGWGEAHIHSEQGDWGARIHSNVFADAATTWGGNEWVEARTWVRDCELTIETSEQYAPGTDLTLIVHGIRSDMGSQDTAVYFSIFRGEDNLGDISLDEFTPWGLRQGWLEIDVVAGETLMINFDNEISGWGWVESEAAVNFWVVPEPASLALLILGGLALFKRRW